MELAVIYRGKDAVFSVDERTKYYEVATTRLARVYLQGDFRKPTPTLSREEDRLLLGSEVLTLTDDEDELAKVDAIIALYHRLQTSRQTKGGKPAIGRDDDLFVASGHLDSPRSGVERAYMIAANVELLAWVLLVAGLVAGYVAATRTETLCAVNSFGSTSCSEAHPYIGLGIGLGVAALFQTAVVIMMAAYIKARLGSQDN